MATPGEEPPPATSAAPDEVFALYLRDLAGGVVGLWYRPSRDACERKLSEVCNVLGELEAPTMSFEIVGYVRK